MEDNNTNTVSLDELAEAIKCDDIDSVKMYLSANGDVNARIQTGVFQKDTLLNASLNNYEMMKLLLENGADPNLEAGVNNRQKRNTLHKLAYESRVCKRGSSINQFEHVDKNDYSRQIKLLCKHGADINAVDNNEGTPLSIWRKSADQNTVANIKALVRAGANIDNDSMLGVIAEDNIELFDYFNASGATICTEFASTDYRYDGLGYSELTLAIKNNANTIARALIERGADVNFIDCFNFIESQPIYVAIYNDNTEIFRDLIEAGSEYEEALAMTAQKQLTDSLDKLINAGADVNTQCRLGKTPAHHAAQRGSTDILNTLLKHGADTSIKDKDSMTIKDIASAEGHDACVSLIERHELQQSRLKPLFDKYDRADQKKAALMGNEKEKGIGL